MTVPGDDNRLFHNVDTVTLHQVLEQVKDLLSSGTLKGKNPCTVTKRRVSKARQGPALPGVCVIPASKRTGNSDFFGCV